MNIKIILATASALTVFCSCGQDIYVATDGDDASKGSCNHPVQTLEKAFDLASGRGGNTGIILRSGRYGLAAGLSVEGLENVEVSSYPGEDVVISGGLLLSESDFSAIRDENVLSRLKPSARDKAMMLDLQDRPELFHGLYAAGFKCDAKAAWSELLFDGKPLKLSRWPKDREMSEPGEYVLDSALKRVYFIAPVQPYEVAELSVLDTALVTLNSCRNVSFNGLTFQGGRSDAVVMNDCSDCVLNSCTIRACGRLAVHIGPGRDAVRNGLKDCEIFDMGSGGVELFGGDRLSLTPGECFLENCRIHDVNRIGKSYRPAVKFGECGNRISHCELFNAPSMAVLFNGNNQLIEYCDIHDVCKEIADQAAIYYGRNPTERGSKIRYSYIHDVRSGYKRRIYGIYHDDGACGVDVFGCIFNNIEVSGGSIGGGSDISYCNCIFMNSETALAIDDRNAINVDNNFLESYREKFNAVNYQEAPFVNEYPELKNYYEEFPQHPKRILVRNNLYFNLDRVWEAYVLNSRYYLHGVSDYDYDLKSNPGLIDPDDPMKGLDMDKVRSIVPDFQPIPFDQIGCIN